MEIKISQENFNNNNDKNTLYSIFLKKFKALSWKAWIHRGKFTQAGMLSVPYMFRIVEEKDLKDMPEELRNKMKNFVFVMQYINYKPVKSFNSDMKSFKRWKRDEFAKQSKYITKFWWNKEDKMEKRWSLKGLRQGLTNWARFQKETFKENFPKLKYYASGDVREIPWDFKGYLWTFIDENELRKYSETSLDKDLLNSKLESWEVIRVEAEVIKDSLFFTKVPALIRKKSKSDFQESLFKKVKSVLKKLEDFRLFMSPEHKGELEYLIREMKNPWIRSKIKEEKEEKTNELFSWINSFADEEGKDDGFSISVKK